MNFDKSMLFFCYDFALKKKLTERKVEYITTATSNKGQRFWLYFRTPEVNEIIDGYLE
jgi:hypothetical protein